MSEQLDAEQVGRKDFSVSFRGFDQHEVRAFLAQVAGELGAWEERERSLRSRLAELERPPEPVELDEAHLEAALGQAATRIIHAAREAAAETRERADRESSEKIEEADAILAKATDQASEATASIRAEAEESAAAIVEEARANAAAMMVDAAAERDRTLRELSARRAELLAELDELTGARARLRDAYDSAQRALDAALHAVDGAGERAEALIAGSRGVATEAPPPVPETTSHADVVDEVVAEVIDEVAPEPDAVVDEIEIEEETSPISEPEERRSSSLTLRRPVTEAGGTPTSPPSADPYEGVRIIRPDAEDEPVTGATEAVVAEEPPLTVAEPAASDEPPAAVEEPEPEAEPEPASEPEAAHAPVEDAPAEPDEPVEDLFARLRADRADKVARAEAVLAATDASPTEPDHEPTAAVAAAAGEESPDHVLLASRDAAVADAERGVLRSLKRALADEQNEVLDALRRLRGAPTLDALLPDVAVHDARYDAVLGSGAVRAAGAGGDVAGGTGGNASTVTREIGRAIASDLRSRVARSIDDASGDVDTLAEAISATYREWKTARAETLAREVITAAFASGTYTAASGDLRWVVDPAEGGCPDCEDNVLAGPTAKGTAFPTGQLHPPAHAGCRCALVPVS